MVTLLLKNAVINLKKRVNKIWKHNEELTSSDINAVVLLNGGIRCRVQLRKEECFTCKSKKKGIGCNSGRHDAKYVLGELNTQTREER